MPQTFMGRQAALRESVSVGPEPSDPFDVIPCGVLVAGVALVDFGVRLVGNLGAHLPEVRRPVTRRDRMALSTVPGRWRRMPIHRDRPPLRPVAGGTVHSEFTVVWILLCMTDNTVQP